MPARLGTVNPEIPSATDGVKPAVLLHRLASLSLSLCQRFADIRPTVSPKVGAPADDLRHQFLSQSVGVSSQLGFSLDAQLADTLLEILRDGGGRLRRSRLRRRARRRRLIYVFYCYFMVKLLLSACCLPVICLLPASIKSVIFQRDKAVFLTPGFDCYVSC